MNHASAIGSSRNPFPSSHRHHAAASIDNVALAIRAALRNGSSVVWIGTDTGLRWLDARLARLGVDVIGARNEGRVVCLDVTRTLAEITVDELPDATLFAERVGAPIDAVADRAARVMIVGETATVGIAAFAFEALLKSFARSRAIFSYRACDVDWCRREPTTQSGRNRWSVVEADASLAVLTPIDHTSKERT